MEGQRFEKLCNIIKYIHTAVQSIYIYADIYVFIRKE